MTTLQSLDARQQAFLRQQVALSIAINALIPTGIIWMMGIAPPEALLGHRALLPGMMLASGLATLCMTLGLTLAVRASVRRGSVSALKLTSTGFPSRALPAHLLARGISMSLLAVLLLVPCGIALLTVAPILPLSPPGFIAWNILYGAAVGLTMTPWVVRRALADAGAVA